MSDTSKYHASGVRNNKQQRQQTRTKIKKDENHRFRQTYPTFEIPTSYYKLNHVNEHTSFDEMQLLIDHVRQCNQFTIDTESEKSNGQLALIQIQTIPSQLPSLMILVELVHLPPTNSSLYVKIKEFFELIFRSNNELYSWGDLNEELSPTQEFHLFNWPITSVQFNIQPHFSGWYEWALTHCESCDPKHHRNATDDVDAIPKSYSLSKCACHEESPYRPNEKWSLQKALIYAGHMFIDKSNTLNHWAAGLTSNNSTLTSFKRQQIIRYAIYDCFAVTYLIQPVMKRWTFNTLQDTRLVDLFTSFQSSPLPEFITKPSFNKNLKHIDPHKLIHFSIDDLEAISDEDDDEIFLSQLNTPVINKQNDCDTFTPNEQALNVDSLHNLVESISNPTNEFINNDKIEMTSNTHINPQNKTSHQRRSIESRQRRNRKRNRTHRLRRYQYYITRPIYYKFNMPMVKQILKQIDVHYINVKVSNDLLIIGVKNDASQRHYQQQIPADLFNRREYQRYRRNHGHSRQRHNEQ